MKRFALFSCSLFLCLLVSKANPISRSQALSQAKEFLSSKGISMKTNDVAYRAPRKANAQSDENSAYYVFNAGNDNGFVIVSGDDRTEQILGYSDTGSFDENDVPKPLQHVLNRYQKEIEALGDLEVIPTSTPKKVIEKTRKAIAPMTTSKWGHGYPYDQNTPLSGTKHTSVGCIPTAVGQFLYYYRDKSVKSTTADIPNGTGTIKSGTTIDWANMLDEYAFNSGYTETQIDAVANFLLYCGRSMKATYGSSTDVTYSNILPALTNYFGYNGESTVIYKDFYSPQEWNDIIYNELINGRIVLLAGETTGADGHAFIADGYDSDDFFHINWGWFGRYNGYFKLSVLCRYNEKTSIVGDGSYNAEDMAFLYLSPQKNVSLNPGSINPESKKLSAILGSASGSTIKYYYYNQTGYTDSYLFGIGYLDGEKAHLLKEFSTTAASSAKDSYVSKSYTLALSDFTKLGLKYGDYDIVPMCKLNGDKSEWKVCQYAVESHAVVKTSASGISSSVFSNLNNIKVSNSDIDITGSSVVNTEHVINATISNISSEYGYTGRAYFFVSKTTTKGTAIGNRAFWLGANDKTVVSMPYTPTSAGTYTIWIATDATGSNVIGQTKLTIKSATVPKLDVSGVKPIFKNDAGTVDGRASVWGSTVAIDFTGFKNTYSYPVVTKLTVWLREYDSLTAKSWNYNPRYTTYKDNATYYSIDVEVPAGATNFTIPVEFKNAKLNTKYDVRLEYASNSSNIKTTSAFVLLPAVTTWKADGSSVAVAPTETVNVASDVVAVDITSAETVDTISPNKSNPNVLYYMGESQSVKGLTGKNVIKGTSADKITLKEKYDFFVPKTFTAKSIQYSMTPTKGAEKGKKLGWSTISLPFDVTYVMNTTDNDSIDWFHSDDDRGKDFWVRGFEYLDTEGDNIVFDNSKEMLAYEPYIVNVPGEYYGNKWNLVGKVITFYGENAELQPDINHGMSSSVCNFYGTTTKINVADSYVLNSDGDKFIYKSTEQSVPAFQGYFYFKDKEYLNRINNAKLGIKFVGDEDDFTDGIMIPFATESNVVNVYNLNGVKVATKSVNNGSFNIDDLPKGVYVINGQKFIRY